jgi:hypothetical protein
MEKPLKQRQLLTSSRKLSNPMGKPKRKLYFGTGMISFCMASNCLMQMAQFYLNRDVVVLKRSRIKPLRQCYKEMKELLALKVENTQQQDFTTFNLLLDTWSDLKN